MTYEIKKEIRIQDHQGKKYIKNKIGTNERKYKNQRNKVNNMKKSAKENFYVNINEGMLTLFCSSGRFGCHDCCEVCNYNESTELRD